MKGHSNAHPYLLLAQPRPACFAIATGVYLVRLRLLTEEATQMRRLIVNK